MLDVGWVAGYLMIGLAALWPTGARREVAEGDAIDVWQLALPWVAIGGVGMTAIGMALTGNAIGPVRTFLIGAIAILVMVTQVYAHNESRTLLIKTQQYAATLNEIILYAPLGVVRIGLDMTIIQANPRLADLLRRPEEKIVGTPLASLPPARRGNPRGRAVGRAVERLGHRDRVRNRGHAGRRHEHLAALEHDRGPPARRTSRLLHCDVRRHDRTTPG